MLTSFSSALSALKAHNMAVDVVGNNLANINTTGFKASDVRFHDLLARSLGSGAEVGFGVAPPRTVRQFAQGSLQPTSGQLDAAIQGNGFFVLRNSAGKQLYTRAGSFLVDETGTLKSLTGETVMGWSTNANGSLDTNQPIGPLVVTESLLRPIATSQLALGMNLNAAAQIGDSLSTPVEVVDALGVSYIVTVTLTKSAQNEWSYVATIPGSAVGSPNPTVEVLNSATDPAGPLIFNSLGELQSPGAGDPGPVINIAGLVDGAPDLAINWNLYDSNGRQRVTQFSAPSATGSIEKDGRAAAQMTNVRIVNGGAIVAEFANEEQLVIGLLAMAHIRNPSTLHSVGNNAFEATTDSAVPAIGPPNTGGRGEILGSALELSNVDLASEFTDLIIFQRGYQANTRVITTADEMSQEAINLKR
jgi:flagellar hook protein FlgE